MSTIDVQSVLHQVATYDIEAFVPLSGIHAFDGVHIRDIHVPGTPELVAEMLNTAATPELAGQVMLRWLLGHLADMGLWEPHPDFPPNPDNLPGEPGTPPRGVRL